MKNNIIKRFLFLVSEYDQVICAIFVFIVIILFVRHKYNQVDEQGIITVAKVLRYEGAVSGSDLYIQIFLKDTSYITSINHECGFDCIGNYFFIKVSKDNPTKYPIFYSDRKVPECILKKITFFKGWKKIPTCESF